MVDPNRKINRLSEDDAAFLRECEQEFRNRFTENDEEFMKFCNKPTHPPPLISPWQSGRRQDTWRGNNYRGGDGGGNNYNNRRNHQQPYHRRNNDFVHRNPRHHNNRFNRGGGSYDRNYRQGGSHGDQPGRSYNDRSHQNYWISRF